MPRDRAKNTLQAASNLKTLSSAPLKRQDAVSSSDPNDLYVLNINGRSSVNINLVGISRAANVDIELFALKGTKKKVLDAIGSKEFGSLSAQQVQKYLKRVGRSRQGGNRSENLTLELDSGDYYLRVYHRQGKTNYTLNLAATPTIPQPNPPAPPPTPAKQPSWLKQFGTKNNDYTYGTTIDSAGNVYAAGVTNVTGSAGTSFVAKYDTNGNLQWQRSLDIPGADAAFAITVDSTGNYYVAGVANVSDDLPNINSDGYVAKYGSDGTLLWSQPAIIATQVQFFGTRNALDAASGITLDRDGNVFVSGFLEALPMSSNQGDAFVAKYNGTTGQLMTDFGNKGIARFGNTGAEAAAGVAVDQNNNVYLTGIRDASLTSNADQLLAGGDAFVAKYNGSTGAKLWDQTLKSNGNQDYARGIAIDTLGNVYITGQTEGTLPAGNLSANTNAGGVDGFVAKYSGDGTFQWSRQFGTSGLDESQAISLNASGGIYLTGETTAAIFGNTAIGGSDAWIANYNSDGALVSSTQLGTTLDDETYGIIVDATNAVYVVGQTRGTLPGNISAGNYDGWIAKYIQF